ncbi:hypothetical protein [Armatimonas sp.]|uniref:hypothetical protein n=1 Tax=Armatimonas sp. TaxID=1872638 RepID=UPI00286B7B7F|nr:hypothetical protein [Armatimonas sp.]
MWSRFSKSSPIALVALVGCSSSSPRPVPSPKPTEALVRLDVLMARHPLSAALPKVPSPQPLSLERVTAPPLLTEQLLAQTSGWDVAQQRRLAGRDALTGADQVGVQEFGERLRRRQARLLEISKAQIEGQEQLLVAGKAQEDREEAQKSIVEQLALMKDDISLAQTQYQVSQALASPENNTLLIRDEPEKVAAEVERLKKAGLRAEIQIDPTTQARRAKVLWADGVPPRNPRVLYAASRDVLKVLCDQMSVRVAQVEVQAEEKRKQSAQDRDEEVRRRVAQRLEGIRSRDETFLLRLDQEENLSRILLAEELPTRRAAGKLPAVAIRPPQVGTLPKKPTVQPILKREESASSPLEAELRAAVLDVAQRRRIRVSFTPRPGLPDRTTEFANWIKVSL